MNDDLRGESESNLEKLCAIAQSRLLEKESEQEPSKSPLSKTTLQLRKQCQCQRRVKVIGDEVEGGFRVETIVLDAFVEGVAESMEVASASSSIGERK
ncbi:hypothetical protein HN873_028208, partial [Arachis hypogaea]